ncbi:DUF4376 domain-containing protein [Metapseudomonas otitidis]|uniref:DUF4376 domain-containing protein n=1 Tax=Metapseudomonas otitidis TaxID=319939 RepID=UPI002540AEB4|nr:DUF4376 domain-containing protein [Pseudomonas otitidis]WIF66206.1 DUF4376 domain-containing protein [Pseudomonas otitidis]
MNYLRSPITGEVYAFSSDGSEDAFIPSGLITMTSAEVEAHLNPLRVMTPGDVDIERDHRLASAIEFQGALFQSRSIDRERITEAAQLAFMAVASGAKPGDLRWLEPEQDFTWIAADNTLVPMDAPTVMAFAKAMAARTQALVLAGRRLKDMDVIPSDYTDDKWWP